MERNKKNDWEILNQEFVIDNEWLKIVKIDYLLPNGEELKDYYVAEKNPVCVMVPINEKGEVFLIREYERGIGEYGYKFPSGRLDEAENPLDAAKRELGEEVGVGGEFHNIGKTSVDPGFMTTWAHFFIVTNVKSKQESKVDDPTELFEGKWTSFEKVLDMVKENEIKNPFVISACYFAKNYLDNL